jgi:hypothetical protein
MARRFTELPEQVSRDTRHKDCIRYVSPCREAGFVVASLTPCAKASITRTAGLVDASPDVERDVDLVEDMPDFARAGTRLGRVVVRVDGRRVGETLLVARGGYQEASFGQRVWYTVEGIFE